MKRRMVIRFISLLVFFAFMFMPICSSFAAYVGDGFCGHMDTDKPYDYINNFHCQCTECNTYRNHSYSTFGFNVLGIDPAKQHRCKYCETVSNHFFGEFTSSARCSVAASGESCTHPIYSINGAAYDESNHICRYCGYIVAHRFPAPGEFVREIACECGYKCPHSSFGSSNADGHVCDTCGWTFSHTFTPDAAAPATGHKCSTCGYKESHTFADGKCTKCGYECSHFYDIYTGKCSLCDKCLHSKWNNAKCVGCGIDCPNLTSHSCASPCGICGFVTAHKYVDNGQNHKCSVCGGTADHTWSYLLTGRSGHSCSICSATEPHLFADGKCTKCGYECSHFYDIYTGKCNLCDKCLHLSWDKAKCAGCGIDCPNLTSHSCASPCSTCGFVTAHNYVDNGVNHKCSVCNATANHDYVDQGAFVQCSICSHTDYKPVAVNDSVYCNRNEYITIPVLANDLHSDPGTLTPVLQTGPAHGTAVLSGNNFLYTPARDWIGTDSFTYTASDGISLSNVAQVNITVKNPNHSSSGGSTPVTPTYNAAASGTGISGTNLPVTVNTNAGSAAVDLGTLAGDVFNGEKTTVITVPSVPGVSAYTLGIPVAYLSTPDGKGTLTFKTDTGSMTLPADMLAGISGVEGKKAEITIGRGDKSGQTDSVNAAIGDRPLIQLAVTIDGKQTEWNNPNTPVTISIPYTPKAAELANPESIIIWYIDGSGKAVSVPNGHYDPATGTVTFTTTHFSSYAVGYSKVSFKDVAANAWYNKAVGFIAARGITTGTGNGNYSPEAKLTRGEFLVMMMKAYGIEPDANPKDNFADAGSTYYTGYLAAAKRLGISGGVGNNMFAPGKKITRQEMFTLLYNALKAIGRLPEGSSGKSLSAFSDAGDIAPWAKDVMKLMAETGTFGGNGGKLSPTKTTTRAEMAQVLYNLLSK